MSAAAKPAGVPDEPTFDERLERLEKIVAELEQGRIGLEDSIGRYQEGVALMRSCRATLDQYRRRIEELQADGSTTPFVGDPDEAS